MVFKFLKNALGTDAPVTNGDAVDLVAATAAALAVDARTLDHMMWRLASGRPLAV